MIITTLLLYTANIFNGVFIQSKFLKTFSNNLFIDKEFNLVKCVNLFLLYFISCVCLVINDHSIEPLYELESKDNFKKILHSFNLELYKILRKSLKFFVNKVNIKINYRLHFM